MRLDLKRGLLLVDHDYGDDTFALRMREVRFVSSAQRSIGLQRIKFEVLRGEVDLRLEALIGAADASLIIDHEQPGQIVWRTQSRKCLAICVLASVSLDGVIVSPAPLLSLGKSWTWRARVGQVVEFKRQVAFCRSARGEEHIAPTALADLGPDEYHETIYDNAFTNVMAGANIRRAVEVADVMRSRWPSHWATLCQRLGFVEAEIGGLVGRLARCGLHQSLRLFGVAGG